MRSLSLLLLGLLASLSAVAQTTDGRPVNGAQIIPGTIPAAASAPIASSTLLGNTIGCPGNTSGQTVAPCAITTLPDGLTLGATALFGGTWGSGSLTNNRAPIWQNVTFAGTTTNAAAAFALFLQQSDNSSNTGYAGIAGVGINEHLTVNGSSSVGQRIGGQFIVDSSAASGNVTDPQHIALGSKCNMNTTDTPSGGSSCFGFNAVASANASITAKQIVGAEIDTWTQTGATIQDRIGEQIVDVTGATYGTQATRDDVSLALNNQYAPSSSLGYKVGLEFGRTGGNFPVYTTGTIIYGQGNAGGGFTVAHGIDWHLGTFTTDSFNDGINSLTPTGPNTTQAYKISGNKILSLPNGSTTSIALGLGAGGSTTGTNHAIVGAGAGALLAGATSAAILGQGAGTQITSGNNNVVVGPQVASTTLSTGGNNVVIGTSSVCDVDTGGRNNSLTLCAGGGALIRVLGGSTANTSTTTVGGSLAITTVSTGTNADFLCLSSTGLVLLQSSACTISSKRFKEHIRALLHQTLNEIMNLQVVSYNRKYEPNPDPNYNSTQTGLIAENVEKVMPECAIYENDMKTVKSYRPECIVARHIKATQELYTVVKLQQKEIWGLIAWCLILSLHGAHRHWMTRQVRPVRVT